MNPLKIFLNTILQTMSARSTAEAFRQDALDHPDIQAMDLLQLADLPMPYLPMPTPMVADAEAQPESMPLARCA